MYLLIYLFIEFRPALWKISLLVSKTFSYLYPAFGDVPSDIYRKYFSVTGGKLIN